MAFFPEWWLPFLSQFCGKCPIGITHTAETFIDNIVLRLIPAVLLGRRVVDGYVRVGPNRWSRRSDVSGV